MKLFKAEVKFKRRTRERYGVEALVHARSSAAAKKRLEVKYPGAQVSQPVDLGPAPKHFVIADLVD